MTKSAFVRAQDSNDLTMRLHPGVADRLYRRQRPGRDTLCPDRHAPDHAGARQYQRRLLHCTLRERKLGTRTQTGAGSYLDVYYTRRKVEIEESSPTSSARRTT